MGRITIPIGDQNLKTARCLCEVPELPAPVWKNDLKTEREPRKLIDFIIARRYFNSRWARIVIEENDDFLLGLKKLKRLNSTDDVHRIFLSHFSLRDQSPLTKILKLSREESNLLFYSGIQIADPPEKRKRCVKLNNRIDI